MSTKQTKNLYPNLTIIVPMRNSGTTIIQTLESVTEQKYPISEILIIDNMSTDNSIFLTEEYAKKSKIPIRILRQKINNGVGASYNRGAKEAKTDLVVFMHSDSSLPTPAELGKLVLPVRDNKNVVASYSTVLMPEDIWKNYNFWEKCLFARSVGKKNPGMNGKFDCVRKEAFLKVGGSNTVTFGGDVSIGGEDADLYLRLESQGKLVLSEARVIHLHYLGNNYKLSDWIKNRKLLARTYGRLIRFHGKSLPLKTHGKGLSIPLGALTFMIKPALAVLPFIPNLHLFGIVILAIYTFVNSKKMYTTPSTLMNPRIILLPFIDIFLVYYETFWMIQAFLFIKRKV